MNDLTGEVFVDPLSLYSELSNVNSSSSANKSTQKRRSVIPHIFKQSHLQYFSPADFPNHEPPTDGTPEVAFLGRSNTGKSSLINALHLLVLRGGGGAVKNIGSGGGELARTSKTPGRTQTINYFGLIPNASAATPKGKSKLFLVDLPGFGYASAPDESVDEWQKRTQQFLISRTLPPEERLGVRPLPTKAASVSNSRSTTFHDQTAPLKRLYLLLDSRLPEPTLLDLSVMGWCDDYKIPYTIVLTKVDGTSRAHCVKLTNQLCMRYHSKLLHHTFSDQDIDDETVSMDPAVYWTSAKDGLGMEELLLSVESTLFSDDRDDVDDSEMLDDEDSAFDDLKEVEDESKAR
jgi:GTP-binding protein EngB required for normal cell division